MVRNKRLIEKILWIAVAYCVILMLYVNRSKYLLPYKIELRTWVSSSASIVLGIFPFALALYVLIKLYQRQKEKNPLKTLAIFQGGLVVYCVLAFVAILAVIARTIFASAYEAKMLDGNYEVRTPYYLHEDSVSYYEPCTVFARKEISMNDARNTNLLELKYQTKFVPRSEGGVTYYVSKDYPKVKVTITNYSPLYDTYLNALTNFLLLEGEKALGVFNEREEVDEGGDVTYYYVCDSKEKIEEFSVKLAELIYFALEEPIYKQASGGVNCRLKNGTNYQDITLYFGGGMEDVYTEYGQSIKHKGAVSKKEKADSIASILKNTYQDTMGFNQSKNTSYQEEQEVTTQVIVPEETVLEESTSEQKVYSDEEWLNDTYSFIYEKYFKEDGYSYGLDRTAKGALYVSLGMSEKEIEGEVVRIRNTLVYDRESKNEACYLVAFYEEHYDEEGNRQDNTSFLDYYAVVKSTGEVIASGKKGWGDVGTAAYRQVSGE